MSNLEARREALKVEAATHRAINSAKQKAAGRTHRIELNLPRREVRVYYVTSTPETVDVTAVRLMMKHGARTLSAYTVTAL